MAYDPDTDTDTESDSADESPVLPTDRHTGCPFDPPPALTALSDRPVRRLRYADGHVGRLVTGHVGRLVTGHVAARAVLADPRFSSRYELLSHPSRLEALRADPDLAGSAAGPPAISPSATARTSASASSSPGSR
ncbi:MULTISPECIES: hypothetical protein [Streptomyces albovinaceus subgroup]|nr:hypothetical protein [Streptomyces mediolani]WSF78179.1 hypothetical protein OG838_19510 [Streptomyces globisporus]